MHAILPINRGADFKSVLSHFCLDAAFFQPQMASTEVLLQRQMLYKTKDYAVGSPISDR